MNWKIALSAPLLFASFAQAQTADVITYKYPLTLGTRGSEIVSTAAQGLLKCSDDSLAFLQNVVRVESIGQTQTKDLLLTYWEKQGKAPEANDAVLISKTFNIAKCKAADPKVDAPVEIVSFDQQYGGISLSRALRAFRGCGQEVAKFFTSQEGLMTAITEINIFDIVLERGPFGRIRRKEPSPNVVLQGTEYTVVIKTTSPMTKTYVPHGAKSLTYAIDAKDGGKCSLASAGK